MDIPPTAQAVLLTEPGRVEVIEVPVGSPEPDELLVEVTAAGICGSDVELFAGTRPAEFVRYPVVPGHEWAGRVAATGSAVRGFSVGDPVVAQGLRWCGECARCLDGATNLCLAGYRETGFTEPGAFARYLRIPARLALRLPGDRSVEAAALLEPAACVVSSVLTGAPTTGQRIAVVGGGTLGLIAVQLLAAFRPVELVLVDDRADRRSLAARTGATATMTAAEFADAKLDADLVIEAAGGATSARAAMRAARRGGTVVLLGIPGNGAAGLDPVELVGAELHVHGVFGARAASWPLAVGYFADGRLDLDALVSHRFPLHEVGAAIATAGRRAPGLGKVLLRPTAN
ncbi:MAG TPA: alcohol dehydrogenase catalytic domain-containing protein [Pseudonocardiaceae bacterium]|jgi:threonine dehydrogenase-like Zn-dependent dehydrogenase|nr:alcohol dehydrogenase catalytic domain-containing protein [Pseudonocardiaceae bacterium]